MMDSGSLLGGDEFDFNTFDFPSMPGAGPGPGPGPGSGLGPPPPSNNRAPMSGHYPTQRVSPMPQSMMNVGPSQNSYPPSNVLVRQGSNQQQGGGGGVGGGVGVPQMQRQTTPVSYSHSQPN